MNSFKLWLHGLGSAFIGGASTSLATILVDSEKFNITSLAGLGHIALVAFVAGIVTAAGYLKQSPLPAADASINPTANKGALSALLIAGVLLSTFSLSGCSDFERKTFQTLAASQAVINQAQKDYETGKLPKTQATYDAINKAKDAQIAAVTAFKTYNDVKTAALTSNTAVDLTPQQAAIGVALADLGPVIAVVKQLYAGGK